MHTKMKHPSILLLFTLALKVGCVAVHRDAAKTTGEAVPGGTGSMTNEACQSACLSAGFSFAGTEYAGECCGYIALNH
jgi:hypothetical protein